MSAMRRMRVCRARVATAGCGPMPNSAVAGGAFTRAAGATLAAARRTAAHPSAPVEGCRARRNANRFWANSKPPRARGLIRRRADSLVYLAIDRNVVNGDIRQSGASASVLELARCLVRLRQPSTRQRGVDSLESVTHRKGVPLAVSAPLSKGCNPANDGTILVCRAYVP